MTEEQRHSIHAIRELLLEAFNVEELRVLFSFAMCDDLHPVADRFMPVDGKPAMVRNAVEYCQSHLLLDELLAEVKEANPRAYDCFAPELFTTEIEQPREEETTNPIPEILTITSPIHLELVRVAAGEFLMGSVKARDEFAQDTELPPHRVHVPEFRIGRYPITNQQYAAFVRATTGSAPESWLEDGMPPGKENHPVVTVLWKEALAFCAWLREATGRAFRLPSEAEWEKAARGTDGRIYPWGNEPPDETLCNFHDHVGGTTPVGRYSPQGDSPYGCADMAGNIWDWCQSHYKPYPYRSSDGREDLQADIHRVVVRGGSFIHDQSDVRCTARFRSNPNHWDWHVGFRVVLIPDPSGSFDTAQVML